MTEKLSYEELVDHIVNNKPVPNIETVPNIEHDKIDQTEAELKQRSKPWEHRNSKNRQEEGYEVTAAKENDILEEYRRLSDDFNESDSLGTQVDYYKMEETLTKDYSNDNQ